MVTDFEREFWNWAGMIREEYCFPIVMGALLLIWLTWVISDWNSFTKKQRFRINFKSKIVIGENGPERLIYNDPDGKPNGEKLITMGGVTWEEGDDVEAIVKKLGEAAGIGSVTAEEATEALSGTHELEPEPEPEPAPCSNCGAGGQLVKCEFCSSHLPKPKGEEYGI